MDKIKKQRSEFEFLYYNEDDPDSGECRKEGEPVGVLIGKFGISLGLLGEYLTIAERDGKGLEQVLEEEDRMLGKRTKVASGKHRPPPNGVNRSHGDRRRKMERKRKCCAVFKQQLFARHAERCSKKETPVSADRMSSTGKNMWSSIRLSNHQPRPSRRLKGDWGLYSTVIWTAYKHPAPVDSR